MELPLQCSCGHENMIDWDALESRPLSGLLTVQGYVCKGCGKWKPAWINSRKLDEKLRRILAYRVGSDKFRYHFAKTMRYAEQVQQNGMAEYGKSKHENMAESGSLG